MDENEFKKCREQLLAAGIPFEDDHMFLFNRLSSKQLVCALNEGDAEIFDIEVENEKGEDVAWIYFRSGEVERVNIHGDTIITAIREILNCKRLKGM